MQIAFEEALEALVGAGVLALVPVPDIEFCLGTGGLTILAKVLLTRPQREFRLDIRWKVHCSVYRPKLCSRRDKVGDKILVAIVVTGAVEIQPAAATLSIGDRGECLGRIDDFETVSVVEDIVVRAIGDHRVPIEMVVRQARCSVSGFLRPAYERAGRVVIERRTIIVLVACEINGLVSRDREEKILDGLILIHPVTLDPNIVSKIVANEEIRYYWIPVCHFWEDQ